MTENDGFDAVKAEVSAERQAAGVAAAKASADYDLMQAQMAAVELSLRAEADAAKATLAAKYEDALVVKAAEAKQRVAEADAARVQMNLTQQSLRHEAEEATALLTHTRQHSHRLEEKYEAMPQEQREVAEEAARALWQERTDKTERKERAQATTEAAPEDATDSAPSVSVADVVVSKDLKSPANPASPDHCAKNAGGLAGAPVYGSPADSASSGDASFHSADATEEMVSAIERPRSDAASHENEKEQPAAVGNRSEPDAGAIGVGEALGMIRRLRRPAEAPPGSDSESGADSSLGSINNSADLAKMFAKTTAPILRTASSLGGATSGAPVTNSAPERRERVWKDSPLSPRRSVFNGRILISYSRILIS